MSTMRLGTIVGATISTCTLIMIYTMEALAHTKLVPQGVNKLLVLATLIFWLSYVAAHCRDHVTRSVSQRAGDILAAIDAALEEAGDRRATAARLDTLRQVGTSDQNTFGRRPHLVEP